MNELRTIINSINELARRTRRLESADRPVSIVARYSSAVAQVMTGGAWERIDFEEEWYDTHDAVTTGASWCFTAPITGYYAVSASVTFGNAAAWNGGGAAILKITSGGPATYWILDYKEKFTNDLFFNLSGTDVIRLYEGDAIWIAVNQDSGGDQALVADKAYNRVDIWKL